MKKRDNADIKQIFSKVKIDGAQDKELLVVKDFDENQFKEIDKVFVPPIFLKGVLTMMHLRLLHPTSYQLKKVFTKYFSSLREESSCNYVTDSCDVCDGLKRFPKELDTFESKLEPDHPGSHMNADVLRRAGQIILVNMDIFSGYTTACFATSETREDMKDAILQIVTPIRHSHAVEIHTDQAPASKSLVTNEHEELTNNGMK